MTIKSILAREILDSRGNPTVEVDVITECGLARAAVPSGASTGIYEALELRDGGKRFLGKGVLKAVENVRQTIAPRLIGRDTTEQEEIDELMIEMDGTDNKSKLGANAILGVSMAVCRAGAMEKNIPLYKHIAEIAGVKEFILPVPSFNVVNGGAHAGNELDIQEYMMLPVGAKTFREALQMGAETYHNLKSILKEKYGAGAINVGDEGGFAPPLSKAKEPLKLVSEAIKKAGYENEVKLGLDSAASGFFENGKYNLEGKEMNGAALVKFYEELAKEFPIVSYEDPFAEDDFDSFAELTKKVGKDIQIVGDDLLVTNTERIQKAIHRSSCNALLLKLNQIGSVTEAIASCKLAKENKWGVMVSHRSGETTDDFIADLVVGLKTGQIKSGAPCRGERLAKYNQLLRIEEELGSLCRYAGINFRRV